MVGDNEQYAYFAVEGSFDPAEITARLGVAPTKSWRCGEIRPPWKAKRTQSRWSLYSRLDRAQSLESHILDVLRQLDGNNEAFVAISREFGGWLQLVAYLEQGYPGLHFERDVTERLGRYSLAVDFDFYWPSSHQPEHADG